MMSLQIRPEPGLAFILPLITVVTKEAEMLQTGAFCEHTMQQNATAAGTLPQTPLGSLQRFPRSSSWFTGVAL